MDRRNSGWKNTLRKVWGGGRRAIAFVLIGVSAVTVVSQYGKEYWERWFGETEVLSSVVTSQTSPENGVDTLPVWVEGEIPRDFIVVSASSEAPGRSADLMLDGDAATAWACGPCAEAESAGISEFVVFEFAGPVDLSEIIVRNGYPAGTEFDSNNRPFGILMRSAGVSFAVTLEDTSDAQSIITAGAEQTTSVRFEIESVHRSDLNAPSMGISEVTFVGRYVPLTTGEQ